MGWQTITLIAIILFLFVVIIVGVIVFYPKAIDPEIIENTNQNQNIEINNRCIELGCDEITIYVGSKNSDKYYTCDCYHADRILTENIVCFSTDEEALNQGYIKIEDC